MSEFEQWLRRSLDAAVADASPPDDVMRLVRRRHTQRGIKLAASAGAGVLFLAAAVPLARAWRDGGQRPVGPSSGGVLRVVAAAGPDHLDTVPAYYTADYILERAYTRQLVTYRAVPDPSVTSAGWKRDITPVADLATELPTVRNGGITDGGRTYTFHLRPGADWDTTPARQVTAADFLREFKTFCNPAPHAFVGNLSYYASTIVGLESFCRAEDSYFSDPHKHPVTAANVAAFQNSHAISGIVAVNALTLRFRLVSRASDFLNLLALPFASARPAEYERYLPDSAALDKHLISDGPYSIGPFVTGKPIVLSRNPAWRQASDPVRHQYVSKIIVTAGVSDGFAQIGDLQQAKYDLMLDTGVPASALPSLRGSPEFHIWPGSNLMPYVVFNLRSPNSAHATGRLDVRRAVEYGISKSPVQRIFGGPLVAQPINSVQPPGNLGHVPADPYPSPDAARCKAQLSKAGYHDGLKLKFIYQKDPLDAAVFTALKASLARCGIRLTGTALPAFSYYATLGDETKNDRPGAFDLGLASWIPDWFGNNGRSTLGALFRTNCIDNTTNYGCYSNRTVDSEISAAEKATTPERAAPSWAAAARQIMSDAAVVPLADLQSPIFSSARVREAGLRAGVVSAPNLGGPDITSVWLAKS